MENKHSLLEATKEGKLRNGRKKRSKVMRKNVKEIAERRTGKISKKKKDEGKAINV